MFSGIGDLVFKTTNLPGGLAAQRMMETFLFSFEYTEEAEAKEALGYVAGKQIVKSTAEGKVTNTLKIATEYIDWAQLGFSLNQFARIATNEKIWIPKRATVPLIAPYEIADTAIVTGNLDEISAFVSGRGVWGQPKSLPRATTAASPAVGQVGVSVGKLTLNAAQAGAPVTYLVPSSLATVEVYGGPGTPTRFGNLEFQGKVYSPESTDGILIKFPILQRKSRPSLSMSGDIPRLEIEFGAVAPAGWEDPYEYINMDTVV